MASKLQSMLKKKVHHQKQQNYNTDTVRITWIILQFTSSTPHKHIPTWNRCWNLQRNNGNTSSLCTIIPINLPIVQAIVFTPTFRFAKLPNRKDSVHRQTKVSNTPLQHYNSDRVKSKVLQTKTLPQILNAIKRNHNKNESQLPAKLGGGSRGGGGRRLREAGRRGHEWENNEGVGFGLL